MGSETQALEQASSESWGAPGRWHRMSARYSGPRREPSRRPALLLAYTRGRDERAPFEVLDVLGDAGADVGRVIMCHLDRTFYDTPTLLEFAERGCYLEYDFFGWETSYFSYGERDMINDVQRMEYIKLLVDKGYSQKVVIAHDMFAKHKLAKYGGHGFAHIFENIVPRMRQKGFPEDAIEAILVRNPARILTSE